MNNKLLLKGIRVIDCSRILVGSFSSMMLADHGAEVIKIEQPHKGDETRTWGPPFRGTDSIYYMSINRNKKSMTLDLKNPKATNIIHKLITKSDILIENFIPGTTTKLGIDYNTVTSFNDKIIYASMSGFGNDGPLSKSPAFDLTIQAMSGLMNITGDPEGQPYKVGYAATDIIASLHLYSSLLAALLHKKLNNEGQYIEGSLLETNLFSMANIHSIYLNAGIDPVRLGNYHPSISPYGVYKTKDNVFIAIGVATDYQFSKLVKALSIDLGGRFITNEERLVKRKELNNVLEGSISKFTENELVRKLEDNKLPYSKINNMQAIFNHEQIKHRDIVKQVGSDNYGELKYMKPPMHFSNMKYEEMHEPPLLGQHNEYVMRDILGYNEDDISMFKSDKVFG